MYCNCHDYCYNVAVSNANDDDIVYRLIVSFNLGAAVGVGGGASSSSADMGGLAARGEGTAAANLSADDAAIGGGGMASEAFPNPAGADPLGTSGEDIDGPPLTLGVSGGGAVPELNSAHRGHLRLVSVSSARRECADGGGGDCTYSCGPSARSARSGAGYENEIRASLK